MKRDDQMKMGRRGGSKRKQRIKTQASANIAQRYLEVLRLRERLFSARMAETGTQ